MSNLFAGGEDLDFTSPNGSIITAVNGGFDSIGLETTAGSFRSGYARHAIAIFTLTNTVDKRIRATLNAATTAFWTTYRVNYKNFNGNGVVNVLNPMRFLDASGVERIRITYTGTFGSPNDTFKVQSVNAAGTVVQLGSNSTGRYCSTAAVQGYLPAPDKIDVFMNYAVAGQISVYLNGALTYNFTGDVTTNSVTTLAAVDLGPHTNGPNGYSAFSEVLIDTLDTRNANLVTRVATANGNTHNFDGGTAANAATTTMSTGDASPQFALTAGLIDEYQTTPALPTGNFNVRAVVHKARAAIGATGPTKFEFMVRTGGADFVSSDISPTLAWATYGYSWELNPNTGVAWATSELVNASTAYNMGLKSVT